MGGSSSVGPSSGAASRGLDWPHCWRDARWRPDGRGTEGHRAEPTRHTWSTNRGVAALIHESLGRFLVASGSYEAALAAFRTAVDRSRDERSPPRPRMA